MVVAHKSDLFHLRAAEGWLDLGSPTEALAELRLINPALRSHPDVLAFKWEVAANVKDWDQCLNLGNALIYCAPKDQRGWIAVCQTLYFTEHYPEAYDLAIAKLPEFNDQWQFLYELACYAALIGELDQARAFLQRAMEFGDAKHLRRLALEDPDLVPLKLGRKLRKNRAFRTPRPARTLRASNRSRRSSR
jgi:hypothetical protein